MGIVPRGKEKSQASLAVNGVQLHPDVANALGIDDNDEVDASTKTDHHHDEQQRVKNTGGPSMSDVSLRQMSSQMCTNNRSGGSAAAAGRFGESNDYDLDTQAPPPPSPNASRRGPRDAATRTTTTASSVEAIPMMPQPERAQASIPMPVQLVSEPPLAQAVPVPDTDQPDQSTSGILFHRSCPLGQAQVTQLNSFGYSEGLIDGLNTLKQRFPLRFWLVDNSGSMLQNDGSELRGEFQNPHVVNCTRWAELQGSVSYHAALAGLLGTNTVFRLLNEPEQFGCPQIFSVSDPSSNEPVGESVKEARHIISKVVPKGLTPLLTHLTSIRESIKAIQATLRNRGQQAVVVIATDGLPTDNEGEASVEARKAVQKCFASLQTLPVWTVIRLCTDDPEVVSFYNSLDNKLEFSVEVIDDYFHEAKQVTTKNPWLNYAMPLHRCREMGFQARVLDLLDERLLTRDELLEFLGIIFGERALLNAPDPHTDWKKFTSFVQALLDLEREHYDPMKKKKTQWIDLKQLNKCYGPTSSFKSLFKFKR